ncbi:MAG: hypothetical protein L3K19_03830 [Thermoplasmata archaeon]|nr:hypothetical protein [Thermoplasmata archaeon]
MRIPAHHPMPGRDLGRETGAEEDEDRFIGRPCYVFNPSLRMSLNDTRCAHCRFYLTAQCPHIDEFLDDVEDLSPE